jgi:membrane protein DedA with SNARE-associated domain
LGDRELNVLYYCLMNVTENSFILVSVNGALTWFNFVQYGGYLFINTADARVFGERAMGLPTEINGIYKMR